MFLFVFFFQTLLIIVYLGLMIVGLTANLTVIYVVARRAQMHTSRNLYIVNLAVSDMTLCLVCMPFTLTSILRHQWSMGTILCKLVPLLQGTNIMVSVGTITVIAIDRYWVIVRGSAQNERRTVYVSIAIVWLMAVLTTSPVAYYQVNTLVKRFKKYNITQIYDVWSSDKLLSIDIRSNRSKNVCTYCCRSSEDARQRLSTSL